ncbi:hypothetical protein LAD12857_36140 [Lacrimispora amygdalina]|uniref:Uncharacterized protein n=1 Tax=Lacrimispora amygdalina TaxID=253257 RepID=A0ABQ5M9Q5_9FIRM
MHVLILCEQAGHVSSIPFTSCLIVPYNTVQLRKGGYFIWDVSGVVEIIAVVMATIIAAAIAMVMVTTTVMMWNAQSR